MRMARGGWIHPRCRCPHIGSSPPAMTPATATPEVASRPLLGIALMAGATLCFGLLDATAKWLARDYPVAQVVWVRYAVHLGLVLVFLAPRLGLDLFRTTRPALQLARGLLHVAAAFFGFIGLKYLPIADNAAIAYSFPLLVTVLAVPLLGERVEPRRWAAVVAGFVGMLIVIRPGTGVFQWASLYPLGMSLTFSLFLIVTRRLGQADKPLTTLFYMSFIGTLICTAVGPFYWVPPTPFALFLMVMIGCMATLAHTFTVFAFRFAEASLLSPIAFSVLLWGTGLGYLVFGELPDRWTVLGAAIVVGSGIYVSYRESRAPRA
ncbi:MAG: DMT family transporter [Alphaproteobacteria bacterium]|nr:DMT family transporter [Alphaproteobacteria bacterium]